jgi:hypothetical protein
VCAALLVAAPGARADGDPASDVLLSQSLFLPADAPSDPHAAAELGSELAAANGSGYTIRVAIVSSRVDLGSIPELWRRPQLYARFLGQELEQVYTGRLLVVMPDGVGFFAASGASATDTRVIAATPPGGAAGLVRTALRTVRRLETANRVSTAAGGRGSSSIPLFAGAAGVVVLTAGLLIVVRRRR